MIDENDQRPYAGFLRMYQDYIGRVHPNHVECWPLLNGWDNAVAEYNGWEIAIFRNKPFTNVSSVNGLADPSSGIVGYDSINDTNRSIIRLNFERYYNIGPKDAIVLIPPDGNVGPELAAMLQKHEAAIGIGAMKIFLSHKGVNKDKVREFRDILRQLGFDPWLDEDAMPAGTALDRAILEGFKKSCAVIFFITPQFEDKNYLSDEIEYAIAEKRNKKDKFSIITLVFGEGNAKGNVPDLLRRYVWKEPKTDIQALQEVLKALPIRVGAVHWL